MQQYKCKKNCYDYYDHVTSWINRIWWLFLLIFVRILYIISFVRFFIVYWDRFPPFFFENLRNREIETYNLSLERRNISWHRAIFFHFIIRFRYESLYILIIKKLKFSKIRKLIVIYIYLTLIFILKIFIQLFINLVISKRNLVIF